ncbi:MAG TPA: PVC-type heme-binding CxxCH protein [Methylomirabilota bacterium]|nr:PVC-type heme-binding CxxCH protein [Methylomirabilota bacterium]
MLKLFPFICALALAIAAASSSYAAQAGELRVLFLGDNDHHKPEDRFKQLQPVLAGKAIDLVYTDKLDDLNPTKLAGYDGILIFANHTRISPEQESALLQFVENGGGLIPLHCASFCFLNSEKYIALVGGQFKSHGAGVFKETIVNPDHPAIKGHTAIESWDESYVHTKHNSNRVVLAERHDEKGKEPYTWVREHGKGRVFYTAWGHDQRTWGNADFQSLVEGGIRWACANSPTQLHPKTGLKPFEYMEAPGPLPNYVAGARWGTQAEPIRTMQKPLSPEESMKRLVTFPGFEVNLVAAEPEIVKPIWLTWDERGRLWIAETVDYPNDMRPLGEGRDRIKICEDTNGDGKADKFTVFADKLSVPTTFVFSNGGILVAHSGQTEFFKDTNGDDRADERKVVFQGWGTRDTHAGPSNWRMGFDGWIWGVVGYSGFRGNVGGKEVTFGQGIYRFKPDGSALEFVRSSNNNTWGLVISEDNIIFGSTANGNASMYMPIANRYYEAVSGWSASRIESIADSQRFYPITAKVRQVDYHGKYTAGSGSGLYTARSFPKEYWNSVKFVAEPTGHLLGKFHLKAQGADYVSHNGRNFLASDDEWTSPIAAEVGPDGALWVVDWYNYIIQHNPTPQGFENGAGNAYVTPLRDKVHGRIYRVAYNEAKGGKATALDASKPESLLQGLKSDNMLWRMNAQRLIVDGKKTEMTPALCELVAEKSVDEIGLNTAAIHALWTLHGLGAYASGETRAIRAATEALKHPSAAVRRAAVSVLPRNGESLQSILAAKSLEDSDAQVRLAALLTLSEMPVSEQAGAAVFAMLQDRKNSNDRWIPDAAVAAAAKHDAAFLKAALASFKPEGSSQKTTSAGNLIGNASFEEVENGSPKGWRTVTHGGRAEFSVADTGRTGGKSIQIRSQNGADASYATVVKLRPRTDYRLRGWIRTQGVQKLGNAIGALLNIHELQDAVKGATKGVVGDSEWTQVQLTFNSGELTEATINCLFGGWGRASGTAWFDDIELTAAPGSELPGEVGRVVRLVTAHYAQRGPTDTILGTLSALQGSSPALALPVLDGLVSGWPAGKAPVINADQKRQLTSVMQTIPEDSRDRLLALSLAWGKSDLFGDSIASITKSLREKVADAGAAPEERANAARRLIALEGSPEVVTFILGQISVLTPPGVATGLLNALAESREQKTADAIINAWAKYTPSVRRTASSVLLRKAEWTTALLDAVQQSKLKRTDIATEHWAQMRQNQNRRISGRAERLAASPGAGSSDRQEMVAKLLPLAKENGDAKHGKELFTTSCAVCHVFAGAGGKVGPDLSGVGAKDPTEVLTDIIDPNRSVEANYRLWTVNTKDGETLSGRLEAETQTSVEILDTTGMKHVVQRKDIASMEESEMSIMPTGFEALPPDDLKALLAYLRTGEAPKAAGQ